MPPPRAIVAAAVELIVTLDQAEQHIIARDYPLIQELIARIFFRL